MIKYIRLDENIAKNIKEYPWKSKWEIGLEVIELSWLNNNAFKYVMRQINIKKIKIKKII